METEWKFCPAYQECKYHIRLGERLAETEDNIGQLELVIERVQIVLAKQREQRLWIRRSLTKGPVCVASIPSMETIWHYVKTGEDLNA